MRFFLFIIKKQWYVWLSMKYEITNLKNKWSEAIAAFLEEKYEVAEIRRRIEWEHPEQMQFGDYSTNIAMQLAKQFGVNPRQLGEEVAQALGGLTDASIVKAEVAGPGFVNVFLEKEFFEQEVQTILKEEQYGSGEVYTGKKWVVEHTSPNPNKAMHIGHLRNNLTGMALGKMGAMSGARVTYDMIDNNRGIAIAKLMWGYLKFAHKTSTAQTDPEYWIEHQEEWITPEEAGKRTDIFVDELYVKGAEDFKQSKEVETLVRDFVVQWEAENKTIWGLWKKVLDYSYQGQEQTLARLKNQWDVKWHEHEHYQEGKDLVQKGLEIGIFEQIEDGAIITNFPEKYNLTNTVVQKSDGTALYITQDLALTKKKKEKYGADKLFWVIGPEQSLAMKQMFASCAELGIGEYEEFTHIPYGLILMKDNETGKARKMSSRHGDATFIDEFIDNAKAKVIEVLQERSKEEFDNNLAEQIAIGSVKFSFLRVARNQDIVFDLEQATSFEGDSGPYLQYTHARCNSILQKAQQVEIPVLSLDEWQTTDVEKLLYQFPEAVQKAAQEYSPHYIATYLLKLTRAFNSWYGNTKIIDTTDSAMQYKLHITQAVKQIIAKGLWVLGIEAPEKM